jgi:hypothetical protein
MTSIKKNLSALGILFMLALKNPPMPEFAAFQKVPIVWVHGFSRRLLALQFWIN